MAIRTKGEQKAYLDGYEMCVECIEKYLSAEGKKQLDCLLSAVRNAVEIEDISSLSENKGDLISRGEVQSVLHNNLHALIDKDQLYQLYKDINRLTTYSFPDSAENKCGKWERTYLDHVAMGVRPSILYCSVCHKCIATPTNYCPNCGADMRGE